MTVAERTKSIVANELMKLAKSLVADDYVYYRFSIDLCFSALIFLNF